MGHVCKKLHPQSSLGNVNVKTMCLDGNVISVFQVIGDTEEILLVNAEVSFISVLLSPVQVVGKLFSLMLDTQLTLKNI